MIRKRIFFNPQNYKNINQMIILRVCRRKSQKQKKIMKKMKLKIIHHLKNLILFRNIDVFFFFVKLY